jgi:hypothetical protein
MRQKRPRLNSTNQALSRLRIGVAHSIPALHHQPVALILRDLKFLDRLIDRRLLVRSLDDADELSPLDVVDGPEVGLLFGRALGHRAAL